jgi:prepilin-type N-terminal cleavage/methylation domain-containing protein
MPHNRPYATCNQAFTLPQNLAFDSGSQRWKFRKATTKPVSLKKNQPSNSSFSSFLLEKLRFMTLFYRLSDKPSFISKEVNKATSSSAMSRPHKASEKGFTLIEVLIATFIFAIFAAGMLTAIPQLRKVAMRSEQYQTATNLANDQIEKFRTQAFSHLRTTSVSLGPRSLPKPVNGVTYNVSWEVVPHTLDGSDAHAVAARVTVSWDADHFTPASKTFWTIFTANGISDKKFIP